MNHFKALNPLSKSAYVNPQQAGGTARGFVDGLWNRGRSAVNAAKQFGQANINVAKQIGQDAANLGGRAMDATWNAGKRNVEMAQQAYGAAKQMGQNNINAMREFAQPGVDFAGKALHNSGQGIAGFAGAAGNAIMSPGRVLAGAIYGGIDSYANPNRTAGSVVDGAVGGAAGGWNNSLDGVRGGMQQGMQAAQDQAGLYGGAAQKYYNAAVKPALAFSQQAGQNAMLQAGGAANALGNAFAMPANTVGAAIGGGMNAYGQPGMKAGSVITGAVSGGARGFNSSMQGVNNGMRQYQQGVQPQLQMLPWMKSGSFKALGEMRKSARGGVGKLTTSILSKADDIMLPAISKGKGSTGNALRKNTREFIDVTPEVEVRKMRQVNGRAVDSAPTPGRAVDSAPTTGSIMIAGADAPAAAAAAAPTLMERMRGITEHKRFKQGLQGAGAGTIVYGANRLGYASGEREGAAKGYDSGAAAATQTAAGMGGDNGIMARLAELFTGRQGLNEGEVYSLLADRRAADLKRIMDS